MAAPLQIPLPDDRFLQELGHVNKSFHDYGDVELGWYNLGLARATVTSEVQFLNYARRLVAQVKQPWGANNRGGAEAPRENARRRRLSIVLMALRTTLRYQRTHMDQLDPPADFPGFHDMTTSRQQNGNQLFRQRLAEIARPPLAQATIDDLRAWCRWQHPDALQEKRIRRARYHAHTQALFPTRNERTAARARHRAREEEPAQRFGGFPIRDGLGRTHNLLCAHAYRGENNSLWHVLAAQLRGQPANGLFDLRAGRVEKSMVYDFMWDIMQRPLHDRHRMYCQMQALSIEELRQRHGAGTQQLWDDWGEMSLFRCLAVNDPDAGPPKYPQFKGIFQLISDVWRAEVLVWVGDPATRGYGADYELHVFGPRAYGRYGQYPSIDPHWDQGVGEHGVQEGGRGQLVFLTDSSWIHYELPINVVFPYDTSHKTNLDRYAWLNLPFLNQNGPTDILALYDAGATYRTPAEQWRAKHFPHQTECFEADSNAREASPPAWWMPIIPSAAERAAWNQEVDPYAEPLPVEPWTITSGCYRDPNQGPNNNAIRWGRFENIKAFEIHRLQTELTSQNRTWAPRDTITVPDKVELM